MIRPLFRGPLLPLTLLLVALPASTGASSPGWSAARSPHFVVVGDAGEKQVRLVAHQFEQLRGLLQSVVKLRLDSARPMIVLAMRNADGLGELLPRYKAAGRALPAGVFIRGDDLQHVALRVDAGGPVGPYHVIYHEYLHSLNDLNFQRLPLWLDEGLSEYYATADIDEHEARLGKILPQHVLTLRQTRVLLPLERLFAVDHASPEYQEGHRKGRFYAQSAVLTHYLLMADKGAHRHELDEYLELVRQGVAQEQAQERAFGGLKHLTAGFLAYLREQTFPALKVAVRLDASSIVTVQLSEAETLALRADFLLHTGQLPAARELAERAVRSNADLALAHRALGGVLARQGWKPEALVELERAAVLAPQDPLAHYWVGVTRLAAAEAPESRSRRERALRRALELQPAYVPAQVALATLLEDAGRAEEALAFARRAVELEPHTAAWRLRLLSVLLRLGRGAEAAVLERELLQWAHADPGILTQVVLFYEDNDQPGNAVALLGKVRASRPQALRLLTTLGDLLDRLGKPEEAEEAYRDALARSKDDPQLLNSLGYLYAERNVRLPEALGLIDKALKKLPDDPGIRDSRGWALFRLGRLEESERDLRRALEGSPENSVMLDHLGELLAARGSQAAALAAWRRALEQEDLSDSLRAKIEAKLSAHVAR